MSDQNSAQRSARKRQVRRRRTRTNRPRPWSYHADWTDWDYYQTPFVCENASNEDLLNYDNEHVIRKLTEFGENYETWINSELDTDELKGIINWLWVVPAISSHSKWVFFVLFGNHCSGTQQAPNGD